VRVDLLLATCDRSLHRQERLFADFAIARYVHLYLYMHRVEGLEPGVYREAASCESEVGNVLTDYDHHANLPNHKDLHVDQQAASAENAMWYRVHELNASSDGHLELARYQPTGRGSYLAALCVRRFPASLFLALSITAGCALICPRISPIGPLHWRAVVQPWGLSRRFN
jgi:hypothetical protein